MCIRDRVPANQVVLADTFTCKLPHVLLNESFEECVLVRSDIVYVCLCLVLVSLVEGTGDVYKRQVRSFGKQELAQCQHPDLRQQETLQIGRAHV